MKPRRNERRKARDQKHALQETERDPMCFPIKGMTIEPDGMPLMLPAYLGLVEWLITQEWAREQFKADTGLDVMRTLGARGIEAMVDKATGYDVSVIGAWADWVTQTQWGPAAGFSETTAGQGMT